MEKKKSSQGEGICVAIRARPVGEGQKKAFVCSSETNSITQIIDGKPIKDWSFDKVFDEQAATEVVYANIAKSIVAGVVNGINGTVFACEFLQRVDLFALFFML